jgi:hypothetical protein
MWTASILIQYFNSILSLYTELHFSLFAFIFKLDQQCTYDTILKHIRATTVPAEKSISVTYSECVFVALVIQHAMHMNQIVICHLPSSTVFAHIIS